MIAILTQQQHVVPGLGYMAICNCTVDSSADKLLFPLACCHFLKQAAAGSGSRQAGSLQFMNGAETTFRLLYLVAVRASVSGAVCCS
jgi:hypothetical protein